MLRALVTGASGFSGRRLLACLNTDPNLDVFGLSRHKPQNPLVKRGHYFAADAADPIRMAEVIGEIQPDYVFHLIGVSRGAEADLFAVNVGITQTLLESLRAHSPESKVLIVGSAAEYGVPPFGADCVNEDIPSLPVTAYGRSKLAQTTLALKYATQFDMHVSIARPFNILGTDPPAGSLVGDIISRLLDARQNQTTSIEVGGLDSARDYVAVEDVAECYRRILFSDHSGEVFNVCSGKTYTVGQILGILLSYYEMPMQIDVKSELSSHSPVTSICGDGSKAERLLQWTPKVTVEEALKSAWLHALKARDK